MQRAHRSNAGSHLTHAAIAASVILASCSEQTATDPSPDPRDYTVNGTIAVLPTPDAPGSELMIAHDAIPDFVGPNGQTVGMRAMTMPFPAIAPDVSLDGLERGTDVTFTFRVDYAADPKYVVTNITPLPTPTDRPDATDAE